jgi:ATP-dependent RNA helicase DeaD
MNFENLSVKPEIVRALAEMGITEPTTIQEKALPIILSGKDMIGISKTGSGKTAAFGVPLLNKLVSGKPRQFLVLSPTRELAIQIAQELQKFGKYLRFSVTTVYGGVGYGPQIEGMARSEVIVSTPGRLLDHLERKQVDLSMLGCIVLDEADKMVEMGFIEDVEKIIQATAKQKQILLFGATISEEVRHIKQRYMHDPQTAEASRHVEEEYLAQFYYNVEPREKFSMLVHLMKKEGKPRSIVFCSTRNTVEIVTRNLRANGFKAEMIHGKLAQNKRSAVIEDVKSGKTDILVASAVAARGLDIKEVTHIFNYDLSRDPQEYVHRVGRTARAGDTGKSITLLGPQDHDAFNDILRRYQMNVVCLPREDFAQIPFAARQNRDGPRGRRFGRPAFGREERRGDRRGAPRQGMRSGGRSERGYGERDGFRHSGPRSSGIPEDHGSSRNWRDSVSAN